MQFLMTGKKYFCIKCEIPTYVHKIYRNNLNDKNNHTKPMAWNN